MRLWDLYKKRSQPVLAASWHVIRNPVIVDVGESICWSSFCLSWTNILEPIWPCTSQTYRFPLFSKNPSALNKMSGCLFIATRSYTSLSPRDLCSLIFASIELLTIFTLFELSDFLASSVIRLWSWWAGPGTTGAVDKELNRLWSNGSCQRCLQDLVINIREIFLRLFVSHASKNTVGKKATSLHQRDMLSRPHWQQRIKKRC